MSNRTPHKRQLEAQEKMGAFESALKQLMKKHNVTLKEVYTGEHLTTDETVFELNGWQLHLWQIELDEK